jgi:hypothetical protein
MIRSEEAVSWNIAINGVQRFSIGIGESCAMLFGYSLAPTPASMARCVSSATDFTSSFLIRLVR